MGIRTPSLLSSATAAASLALLGINGGCSGNALIGAEASDGAASSTDASSSGMSNSGSSSNSPSSDASDGNVPDSPIASTAAFEFVVNGVIQTPMSCPSENWEFPHPAQLPTLPPGENQEICASAPPCPGATVLLAGPSHAVARQWDERGENAEKKA